MAHIKTISVSIEILENNSWRRLEEFDIIESLKEVANNAQRHTSAIETQPGHFRFLITVHETFEWSDCNALKLLLSFDLGEIVDKYETIILRPGKDACDLAEKLNLKPDAIMSATRKNTAVYCLDSIGMPLELSSEDWYKAEFVFEKLDQKKDVETLPIMDLGQVGHTQIRLDVIPCQVSQYRKRPKAITRKERRPDLLRNVFLGVVLSYNPEHQVDKEYYYKACYPLEGLKYSFVFLYSEVSRRKEIPPESIDYPEPSVESKIRKECSSASSNNFKSNQFEGQTSSTISPRSPITPQNRRPLPTPDSEDDQRISAKSQQKRLFGRTIDWNMVNGQDRSSIVPKKSPKSTMTNASPFICQQDQPSTPDSSLSEIRGELGIVESARREIQAEKVAARTRIRAAKVQNSHKILMAERKIDDTIVLLNDLKLGKEELLREQDELNTQEIRLDDVDSDIEEHLLSATRSVRLYKDQQLQRLEVIRNNKKRRFNQTTPDRNIDTIAVMTPTLL